MKEYSYTWKKKEKTIEGIKKAANQDELILHIKGLGGELIEIIDERDIEISEPSPSLTSSVSEMPDKVSEEEKPFSLKDLFLHPRQFIAKKPFDEKNSRWIFWLIFLNGVGMALLACSEKEQGFKSWVAIILFSLIIGPIIGFIDAWFTSFTLKVIGKWLKGEADQDQTYDAYAWSRIPLILYALTWFLVLPFKHSYSWFSIPTSYSLNLNFSIPSQFAPYSIIYWLVSLCYMTIFISELQTFSKKRALVNILLSYSTLILIQMLVVAILGVVSVFIFSIVALLF